MLPPVLEPHEPEPLVMPVVTRAYEHTEHQGPELLGTSAIRAFAALGWLATVVCYGVAAVALSAKYRHITSDNWRDAIDHIHWLLPLMIPAFGIAYLGWVVWTTLATINAHRVVPLASSPWHSTLAYIVGPLGALAGSIAMPDETRWFVAGATAWVFIGHGMMLISLRSSARRIASDADAFTKLIWFPLASVGYRIIATVALPDTGFDNTAWLTVLVVIDVTLMTATAIAVWRAMHSFDRACARDRYAAVENQLPAFMAAAHRA